MDKVDKSSMAERVTESLREYIDSEKLGVGVKLPSEKELCEKYDVSRTTIREALRLLNAIGYVRIIPNKGAFVSDVEHHGLSALNMWLMEHTEEVFEVYEIRMQLEPYAASLAASQASDEEKCLIVGANKLFNDAVDRFDVNAMTIFDEKFHECIVKASHNTLMFELNGMLSEACKGYRNLAFAADPDVQFAKDTHEKITNAIVKGDSEGAMELMKVHLNTNVTIIRGNKKG